MVFRLLTGLLLAATSSVAATADPGGGDQDPRPVRAYVATYSTVDGEGIFVGEFSSQDGTFSDWRPTGAVKSPASIAIHPDGRHLYAGVSSANQAGELTGQIAGFQIDAATGLLVETSRKESGGTGPCWVEVSPDGRCLLVANCGTATVACLSLLPDGRIGEAGTVLQHSGRSQNSEGKPQSHSLITAPGGKFAIAADLGLDRLFVYRMNSERATLEPHTPASAQLTVGAGPRHLANHPGGRYVYSINELGNTITSLSFDSESGRLETISDVSSLPADFTGESFAADIQIHAGGKLLFGTNRLHDSVIVCDIETATGRLSVRRHVPSGGKFPRSIAISPDGKFLIAANQKSDQLTVFRINADAGELMARASVSAVPLPVCIRFSEAQR